MDEKLIQALRKQISYLERSALLFDQGMQDEAPRMATSLRILMHETLRSNSLLGELRLRGKIKILSTSSQSFDKNKSNHQLTCTLTGFLMKEKIEPKIVPQYENIVRAREIKAPDWWDELIFGMSKTERFSRKDFVLFSANKDGGAHVDKYPKKFQQIKNGETGIYYEVNGTRMLLTNTIECAIRQMTYEFLNSKEIIGLI